MSGDADVNLLRSPFLNKGKKTAPAGAKKNPRGTAGGRFVLNDNFFLEQEADKINENHLTGKTLNGAKCRLSFPAYLSHSEKIIP